MLDMATVPDMNTAIVVQQLTPAIGAEISGIALSDTLSDRQISDIRQALLDHGVIFFRNQSLDVEAHKVLARRFGEIFVHPNFNTGEGDPEVVDIVRKPGDTHIVGEEWHTDHAYDQIPAMGSILRAIEVPPYGGDTVFCSMGAAYEALSERFKEMLAGLNARHSSRHVFGDIEGASDALHPVVIAHPLSGRKGLFVNPQFTTQIDGLDPIESKAILDAIFQHCQQPEFQARVRWQAGDVTMWDNRATWHKAINDYHGHRRYMHRITIEGCALEAA